MGCEKNSGGNRFCFGFRISLALHHDARLPARQKGVVKDFGVPAGTGWFGVRTRRLMYPCLIIFMQHIPILLKLVP